MRKLYFDKDKYSFKVIIEKMLKSSVLPELHFIQDYDLLDREQDQDTLFHKKYYKDFDRKLRPTYRRFIREQIKPIFAEDIVYQRTPNLRVHLPNNVAVGEWHKDREYRDETWAKGVKELNFFIPMTAAFGTNTIWTESIDGKKDFTPIEAGYGEMIEWDASNLTHGNRINVTGLTRVSIDFRVIRKSNYEDSNHVSINNSTPFSLGGYYEKA